MFPSKNRVAPAVQASPPLTPSKEPSENPLTPSSMDKISVETPQSTPAIAAEKRREALEDAANAAGDPGSNRDGGADGDSRSDRFEDDLLSPQRDLDDVLNTPLANKSLFEGSIDADASISVADLSFAQETGTASPLGFQQERGHFGEPSAKHPAALNHHRGRHYTEEYEDDSDLEEIADALQEADFEAHTIVKPGMFTVNITIHSVLDLVKLSADQSVVSPVVFVSIDDKFSACTHVLNPESALQLESCPSGTFERTFTAKLPYLTTEELSDSEIKILVQDADAESVTEECVGTCFIDVHRVYCSSESHCMLRTYVGLAGSIEATLLNQANLNNERSNEQDKLTGFVKVSIGIAGPEEAVPHSFFDTSSQEIAAELENERRGVFTIPEIPKSITRELKYLSTTIYSVEHIGDITDEMFVKVSLGSASMITRPLSPRGDCNTEIWLPVNFPVITDLVLVQLFRKLASGEEVLHSTYRTRLRDLKDRGSAKYANLFGANFSSSTSCVKSDEYNRFPDDSQAPCYRGRVLLDMLLCDEVPGGIKGLSRDMTFAKSGSSSKKTHRSVIEKKDYKRKLDELRRRGKPFRRHLHTSLMTLPAKKTYRIMCLVIIGTEIPIFAGKTMAVRLQVGASSILTRGVENDTGVCKFYDYIEVLCDLTENLVMCPDVTLTIGTSVGESGNEVFTPVSYSRFKFKDVYTDVKEAWLTLREDKAIDLLGNDMFPGSLLVKLKASESTDIEAEKVQVNWKSKANELKANTNTTPYQLRCHIFAGTDLPSVIPGTPLDPFFEVNFNGEPTQRSKMVSQRNNFPTFYETVCFNSQLPSCDFFPQVNVRLFDKELVSTDNYLSCIMVPLSEKNISNTSAVPDPEWYDLFVESPGDTTGRILCSFQLINLAELGDNIPPMPISIKPKFKTHFIEVIVVGCNDLVSLRNHSIEYASLEFLIGDGEFSERKHTKGSKKPSRHSPYFLERKIIEVRLPEGRVHLRSFPLIVNLYDNRSLGNQKKPLIGRCKMHIQDLLGIDALGLVGNSATPSSKRHNRSDRDLLDSPRPDIFNEDVEGHDGLYLTGNNSFQLGREVLNYSLEEKWEKEGVEVPFREYMFTRPLEKHKNVGSMKARVRIMSSRDEPPTLYNYRSLVKLPSQRKKFVVRVYVTQGSGFKPIDVDDMTAKHKKPRPFLKVSLGNNVVSNKGQDSIVTAEASSSTSKRTGYNVDFYSVFELVTTLPGGGSGGVSKLEISAWDDGNQSGNDVLIGSTHIDLLNRFHSKSWNSIGSEYRVPLLGKVNSSEDSELFDSDGSIRYDLLENLSFERKNRLDSQGGKCKDCDAKYSDTLGHHQCYCDHIEWIQKVHQRLEPKPMEMRPLEIPTSYLPRGALRTWIDIIPQADAKAFPTSYFLKNNYVKTLFTKLNDTRTYKSYAELDFINEVESLSAINKAGLFFGKTFGNNMIMQCIEYGNEKLLVKYLRQHPLAVFVRVPLAEAFTDSASWQSGQRLIGEESDSDYSSDSSDEDDVLGSDVRNHEDVAGAPQPVSLPGMELDHQVGQEVVDKRRPRGEKIADTTIDAIDFAIRKGKFELIKVILDEITHPLIDKANYLPEPLTRHLKKLMSLEYHDLVVGILQQLKLVCVDDENDDSNLILRTALPDLGTLDFLTQLTDHGDSSVFDSDTMALVVEDLWEKRIKKRFHWEFFIFVIFCLLWAGFCEYYSHAVQEKDDSEWKSNNVMSWLLFVLLFVFNTFFFRKESRQAKKQAEQREGLYFDDEKDENEEDGLGAWFFWNDKENKEEEEGELHRTPSYIQKQNVIEKAARRRKKKQEKQKLIEMIHYNWLRRKFHLHLSISTYMKSYFSDNYNRIDFLNIVLVYMSLFAIKFNFGYKVGEGPEATLASFASLTLTYKCMSYMRGFSETGWLSKVLNQNVVDMQGFMIIMVVLILGFTVVFRLLMNGLQNGGCAPNNIDANLDEASEWECDAAPYENFYRSMFSVFNMAILGDFDAGSFDNVRNSSLSKGIFVFMMVGITVVSLNGVIALLGDSYANVKENKNATMRSERAKLIIEHLLVLNTNTRRSIEKMSRHFSKAITKKEHLNISGSRIFESDVDDVVDVISGLKKELETSMEGMREEIALMKSQLLAASSQQRYQMPTRK